LGLFFFEILIFGLKAAKIGFVLHKKLFSFSHEFTRISTNCFTAESAEVAEI